MELVLEFIFGIVCAAVAGQSVRATVLGLSLRPVHCPRCARTYWYILQRLATGRDTSYSPTAARAHQDAVQKVTRALQHDTDVVPCPHCGDIPKAMLRAAHRDRLLPTLAVALLASVSAAITSITLSPQSPHPLVWALTAAAATLLLSTLSTHLRPSHSPLHLDPTGRDLPIPTATTPAEALAQLPHLSPSDRAHLLRGEPIIQISHHAHP